MEFCQIQTQIFLLIGQKYSFPTVMAQVIKEEAMIVFAIKIHNFSSEEAWSQFKDSITLRKSMDYILRQLRWYWAELLQED